MENKKSKFESIISNIDSKYYKYLAGLTSAVLALVIFSICNMLGNGKYIFAGLDSEHQYYPYIKYLTEVIKGNAGFGFSWNNGLGQSMHGTLAYYTLSPVNLLYLLFPSDKILTATVLVFVVKVFLSAMIMQMFLSYFFRNNRFGTIVFAVCYSLCAYQMIYFFLVNLADGVYLFPLIMLGIVKLVREGKIKLLLVSYVILFGFNFYMGYIVGINSFILGLAYFLYTLKERNKKNNIIMCLKYIITVLCSLMTTSVIWLPTVIQIKSTGEKDYSSFIPGIKTDPILILNNLFNSEFQSLDGYIPYVFCGLGVFILSILFFLNKSINKRKKIYLGVIFLFYILVMCVPSLNLFMHAFDTPQMLGFRYSFVFSFILCFISCYEIVNIRNNSINDFILVGIVLLFLYVFANLDYYLKNNNFNCNDSIKTMMINIVFLGAVLFILYCIKTKKTKLFDLRVLLYLLICLDIFVSYTNIFNGYYSFKREDTYQRQIALEKNTVAELPMPAACDFYRTQAIDLQVLNVGIQDDFNNISSFNTLSNGNIINLFKSVGMEVAPHMCTSRGMYDVMRSLLGVKYYSNFEIEKNDEICWFLRDQDNMGIDLYHQNNGIGSACWEQYDKNLSLGFMASNDIEQMNFGESPFENMDTLLSCLCGDPINCYNEIKPKISYKNSIIVPAKDFVSYDTEAKLNNVILEDCSVVLPIFEGKDQIYSNYNIDNENIITEDNEAYGLYNSCVTFTFEENEKPVYSYFTRDNGNRYQYTSEIYNLTKDESISQYQYRPTQEMSEEYVLKLGHNAYDEYELLLYLDALNNSYDYFNKYYFASFDEEEFNKAYNILSKNQLKITQFTDGYVAGNISSDEDGIMFTSIPYSNGWKAYVDGNETPIRPILNGSFVGVEMEAGEHSVELNYTVPGLNIGVIISLLGIIGIILLIIIVNKSSNKELYATKN